ELIGELPTMQKLWQQLAAQATLVGAPVWEALDILAGLPLITPATSEAFVPQMVNLDLVDGVSFKKGCYPGQEIVARMKYLGKLKRRMYLARCGAASSCPAPGTHVQISEAGASNNVGMVIHSRPAHDGGCYLLATLDIERAQQSIHLEGHPDWILKLMELPYAVDELQERS
ncbi:MAG: glycine cleavage T protein (aminomethyl transferase), partial [Halothiobacillaceae bacterium]